MLEALLYYLIRTQQIAMVTLLVAWCQVNQTGEGVAKTSNTLARIWMLMKVTFDV